MSENSEHYPELLLVDDDETYCTVLALALKKRGFDVIVAHSTDGALSTIGNKLPEYAVVDLRMPGSSGLELVKSLIARDASMKIVVLTGYTSIATAVEAIKLGAVYYLSKPSNADEIVTALNSGDGDSSVALSETPPSLQRNEWEHIQKVLKQCNGNISETARQLGMHRRTLQRKLNKRPVRS